MSKGVIFAGAQSLLMIAVLIFVVVQGLKPQTATAKDAEPTEVKELAHGEKAETSGHGSQEAKPSPSGGQAPAAAAHPEAAHPAPSAALAAAAAHATAPDPAADAHGHAGPSAEPSEIAAELLAGNARFVAGTPTAHVWSAERQRVQTTQHPRAMILSCSDSRLPPEHIFDQGLGDLFVVRTAGNIADPIAVGSFEYAAEHLGTRLLVVLGHERCGAVTAAASGEKMPTRNLDAIVKKIGPSVAAAKGWATGPARIRLAAETNVARTADDLLKQSPVLSKLQGEGKLVILKAMYDLDSGRVRPLP